MIEIFADYRAMLFGIAYRMLGSVAEAEDMVQETYLRWQRQDAATVKTPKAWLVAAITRLSIDQLRSARHRREEYVGVWLPEPLVDATAPAPDRVAALADSLGVAFLLMLEALTPTERAVFLLREAFDYEYAEIASMLGKSEANCRQMVSRAKSHFSKHDAAPIRPTEKAERIVRRFMGACATGELKDLLAVLTDDAVLYTDGGGKVKAALLPIRTADHIARFFLGIRERAMRGAEVKFGWVNGDIGAFTRRGDGRVTVGSFAFSRSNPGDLYRE